MSEKSSMRKVGIMAGLIVLGSSIICGFAWMMGNRAAAFIGTPPSESNYFNVALGFQADIPEGFTVNESYLYQGLGPGKEIPGVSFIIPAALAKGTNLSSDSYISVEKISRAACVPADFLDTTVASRTRPLGDTDYAYALEGGAGAGNLYEEHIYVRKYRDICYGVRFFIHSTQIGNYPEGTVKAFDKKALLTQFRSIAATFDFI